MRNIIVIVSLSIFYFVMLLFRDRLPFLFLTATPFLVGVAGYKLTIAAPMIRRALASAIPILSLVWILLFSNLQDVIGIVLFHFAIIGLLVVQILEILEYSYKSLKEWLNTFRRRE